MQDFCDFVDLFELLLEGVDDEASLVHFVLLVIPLLGHVFYLTSEFLYL